MIRVAPIQHLIEMPQVTHHRHHMVLDVAEVESDLRPRRDAVLVIATFREPLDNVRFASEEPHEGIDLFAAFANLSEQRREIVRARDKHLLLDRVGFALDGRDHGSERINNVVTANQRQYHRLHEQPVEGTYIIA